MNTLRIAAAGTLLTFAGCAGGGLGGVGDILGGVLGGGGGAGGAQQGQVLAEVQTVNANQQSIALRTEDGQNGTVLFDQNTTVVYQQQQYPVTALERGDVARFQIQQTSQNQYYTSRIDVVESVQERTGGAAPGGTVSGDLRSFSGTVGAIDSQNGIFELRMSSGTYTVIVPTANDTNATARFNALSTGQTVSIQGYLSGTSRIDLYRFL